MKTSAITAADLARSVIAVLPLARQGDDRCGSIGPMSAIPARVTASNLETAHHAAVRAAAQELLAHDRSLQ